MNKSEQLRELLSTFVDYQVIRANTNATIPFPCCVFRSLPATKGTLSKVRQIDTNNGKIIQQASQISEAIYQLDFYSTNQLEAELMAHNFLNLIIFNKRFELVRLGFGISSEFVNIEDRTFIENSKFIYRFGFDIEISSKEVITREMNRIESIEPIKYEEEQKI